VAVTVHFTRLDLLPYHAVAQQSFVTIGELSRTRDVVHRRGHPVCPMSPWDFPQLPAHKNSDVQQRHYRFKQAVEQELMLRGRRDFTSGANYEQFLRNAAWSPTSESGARWNRAVWTRQC